MKALLLALMLLLAVPAFAAEPLQFADGDRVVLLGSTLIEREQKYGHWEAAMTGFNKERNVTFRNLGWSGDTVYGDARAGFDSVAKGYERLVTLTRELKPTVIVICYGWNESFDGEAGREKFRAGLVKLIADVSTTKARVVLMSPIPLENAPNTPDVKEKNAMLGTYVAVIAEVAKAKNLQYIPLFERSTASGKTVTDNGVHPADAGYKALAPLLFESQPPTGDNTLMRAKIIDKNQLFFHRWRPQNETYLFGFRKHEQGNNGIEIPQFDPLVEKAEREIFELRKAPMKAGS
jgi:lysophospholipase L1-like esterase